MEYNRMIDHTLLAPDARKEQIEKLCKEAVEHHFASVCVNPGYVPLAASLLKGTDVKVCTVIGFPLGATSKRSKEEETRIAIEEGAQELDMVINIGRLKDGDDDYVRDEIKSLKEICGPLTLKVIIETCLLTDEEKVRACLLSKEAGADFVKTSTGFAMPKGVDGQLLSNGASVHHVELMRTVVGPSFGVKASGGIRNAKNCLNMLASGANRIGTSSGVQIIDSWDESVKVPRWD